MATPGPQQRFVKRTLVGRRMPMRALEGELLPRWMALPIFASDPLSSVAYATEAALVVLVATSYASRWLIIPISIGIAALLAVVVASYRQTIFAYPNGGGSYVVAKENLGVVAGLVAAASLLTDYVLTAAVSIASGVLAITSAAPELSSYAVELSLLVLLVLVVVNLRGVRESGFTFALPTYGFILSIAALVAVGLVRGLLFGWPVAHVPDRLPVGLASGVSIIILLRAFASGCSALTGVEAISNGVTAFRRPQPVNAASTLLWMGIIAICLFMGVSVLAWKIDALPSGSVSVLSEIARAVFPAGSVLGVGYYVVQATTALVLALAANTAFQGFPRLAALLAGDSFLPRQFSNLGDRLVFSNGILVLAFVAGALIVGFNANVNSLIQLYLLGVFTAFTLSQFGMVRHNWVRRGEAGSGSTARTIGLNAVGGALTGLVGLIVAATKFNEGAWMVTIAIPAIVLLFVVINRHYRHVGALLADPPDLGDEIPPLGGPVVLYVGALDDATAEALRYVRAISGERFHAIHVAERSGITGISQAWRAFSDTIPPLVVLPREHTTWGTVARYVAELERAPGELVTVVIPELLPKRSLVSVLRGRTALALKLRLYNEPGVVVTDVPIIARSSAAEPAGSNEPRRMSVLVPMAEVNAASRRALGYALGLGAPRVEGLHVALGADDVERLQAGWDSRHLPVEVRVVPSPFRDLGGPLLEEIRKVTADPGAVCAVVLPEIISPHRWQRLLHNQRALFVKRLLLFEDRAILTSVPFHLEEAPGYSEQGTAPSEPSRGVPRVAGAPAAGTPAAAAAAGVRAPSAPVRAHGHSIGFSTDALWRFFEGLAGSIALLGAIVVALLAVRGHVSAQTIALALILPPLVAAMSGRALALAMAIACALVLNYFFIPPYYSFSIDTSEGVTAFVVYITVAMCVAIVAGRLRTARGEAERRVGQRQALNKIAEELLAGAPREDVLRRSLAGLAEALSATAAARFGGGRPILARGATPELLDVETPSARVYAATLEPAVRIVVDSGSRVTRDQREVVDTLARLLASAGPGPEEGLVPVDDAITAAIRGQV